jgi:small-conductance mechanosensitive channel
MINESVCRTKAFRLPQALVFLLVAALAIAALVAVARAQETAAPPAASPASSAATSPTPAPSTTPIPLAEVVAQAETVSANLRSIEADLATDQVTAGVDAELPVLIREIDARLDESQKILSSRPSLETLKNLDSEWKTVAHKLVVWKRDLTIRATGLDQEITRLTQLDQTWSSTLRQAESAGTPTAQGDQPLSAGAVTPPEILQRIHSVIAAIKQTRDAIEKRRAHVLTLQNRVADQDTRIAEALASVRRVREETINRLFVKDSPSIWSGEVWSRDGHTLLQDSQSSFTTQLRTLRVYAQRQSARFIFHGLMLLSLVVAIYWARRRVRPLVLAEPSLQSVAQVFAVPIATALVLSILISGWVYPQAPRMLNAILGAAALIPTIIILRQLVERTLFPVLNALVVFYFIDLLRTISTALPLVSRLLFLAEMLGGLIFLVWLIKSRRLSEVPDAERNWLWTILRIGTRIAGLVFPAAFIANVLGYVSIAGLAGDAVLGSAYVAVILYAAIRIADGMIMFALRMRPLSQLGMVRRHRRLVRRRVQRTLRWIAALVWVLYTLELFSLRAAFAENIRAALSARLVVGELNISLGNIVAFVVTVWVAFLLSRFLRFLLEEDIYPRVNLARGVPYAVSTMLHYMILLVGFFLAVAAMGIDMTKFTILAGAFGVGLGFGLQNIVNNFVSGLILLFERPVHVGDMIQVGEREGRLRRIGMRASVIRTLEGSEVIVPNGQLISEEVLNWTLSDQQRRLEIPVGVAYGTDPERVIEVLTAVGLKHPEVINDPPPDTLFIGFGDSALNFQLRAWTGAFKRWQAVKSELTLGMNAALRDAGISIPFPQRDLYIKSVAPESVTSRTAEAKTPTLSANTGQETASETEK